jgi:ribokinase
MNRFDAVGFGGLNVDKLFKVDRIAGVEEESFITDYQEACGGSAANTIVGLARLGCKVSFIGKVADDREAKLLTEDFRKENVDINGIIQSKQGRSGSAMGFVDKKGERALYVDPGVNDTIELKEINVKYAFQTRFLHITSFVGEESFQAQQKLVDKLPNTVKLSFDPGELYARKGAALDSMIKRTYVLMPSRKELQLLTKTTTYTEGAKALLKKGVKIVAVKLGSKGCYITDEDESHYVQPFKVKVVDTTGAGDAFCAGFLFGLIKSKSLYECGRLGNFVASRCIVKMGARSGLPYLKDLKFLG